MKSTVVQKIPSDFLAEELCHEVSNSPSQIKILFIQTETPSLVIHAIRKLKGKTRYAKAKIILVCREEDRKKFKGAPQINKVLTYQRGDFKANLKLARLIRKVDADIACAIFSGRPFFRKSKLLFFVLPIRQHLIFDAQLDCHHLTPLTLARTFQKAPPLPTPRETLRQRVLLLQTANHSLTIKALDILLKSKVVGDAEISIFCSEVDRQFFESLEKVREVIAYHPGKLWVNFGILLTMARKRTDVIAALFSQQLIYRKQKILFFLMPAKHRLVFNRELDCFYLNWKNFSWLLSEFNKNLASLVLRVLRLLLFVPRFLYLLIWAAMTKLKRAFIQTRSR